VGEAEIIKALSIYMFTRTSFILPHGGGGAARIRRWGAPTLLATPLRYLPGFYVTGPG
jgi:hypothetical protein